jgi:hypothetical protein
MTKIITKLTNSKIAAVGLDLAKNSFLDYGGITVPPHLIAYD